DRRHSSDAARRDVAMDLPIRPEKDDAMSGRVSFVPFDLVVRDDNPFSYLAVWAAKRAVGALVGDYRHIAIIIHVEAVRPICVGFATARQRWNVGLHELLKPLAYLRWLSLPLSKIAGCHRQRQKHESNDDAAHARLLPVPSQPLRSVISIDDCA